MSQLPPDEEMYRAFMDRNADYDGIFFTGVRTTGIFCRPTCPARKPKRSNIEYHPTARAAIAHGFRPCRRCHPLELRGETPAGIRAILRELDNDPSLRLKDADLRDRGLDPAMVRRWFNRNHGMTFHAYQRGRRLARAIGKLSEGAAVTETAFDSGYDSLSGFQEALRKITGMSPAKSRESRVVHLSRVLTPLGPMLLGATDDAVCLLEFTDRRMLETQLQRVARRFQCAFLPGANDVARQLEAELESYFRGDLTGFRTPLALEGTEFQEKSWKSLLKIPYGETRSYGEQAVSIDRPTAVRAVARANGDNRIAIVVPCHRVIGADGKLTGYGGGLWRKLWLLRHEGVEIEGDTGQLGLI